MSGRRAWVRDPRDRGRIVSSADGGDGSGPQGMGPGTQPARFAADDSAAPRGGQMSKEERRQLRRDVHEAGRDLYPERRRGGRQQQNLPPMEPAPAR
jgi:hypothetical protein